METPQTKRVSSYAAGPPWVFKGRALYQLHLVKAEIAQKIIPKELKLVQAFGYPLINFLKFESLKFLRFIFLFHVYFLPK
jgi:hypothetical protein